MRRSLQTWLRTRTGAPDAEVSQLHVPQSNGMSSETLLFDAIWTDPGGSLRHEHCVARVAPAPDAMPVFPEYRMEAQFTVMRLVAERTRVPVPRTLWYEADESVLGASFFVMEKVDGLVPPDILPYTFGDNWLFEASDEQRRKLQNRTVRTLAAVHAVDLTDTAVLGAVCADGDAALRAHLTEWRRYYAWAHGDQPIPVLDACFAWLEDHWPATVGPPVLSWGDARIGNIMYEDFTPVAVLDWEMASTAPREVDLTWLSFLHRFFQDIAEFFALPGLPGFLDLREVAAEYEAASGYTPRDLPFYEMYAALRHGLVMARVNRRRIRFGEQEAPQHPDDLVNHKDTLLAMLDGTYWSEGRGATP
jgi:aminoglycoside phosphotransferase (APT) family kinase protein